MILKIMTVTKYNCKNSNVILCLGRVCKSSLFRYFSTRVVPYFTVFCVLISHAARSVFSTVGK